MRLVYVHPITNEGAHVLALHLLFQHGLGYHLAAPLDKVTGQLQGRKPLFGVQHERDREKPFLQRQVGIVENCANQNGEPRLAVVAAMALLAGRGVPRAAVRAEGISVRPARFFQMRYAVLICWKPLKNRYDVHGMRAVVASRLTMLPLIATMPVRWLDRWRLLGRLDELMAATQ